MDEIIKKVLIDVSAKSDGLKRDVGELNLALDNLVQKQKAMGKQTADNSKEFVENATKIRLTRDEIRNTNREIDNSIKALSAQNNSIAQNEALLSTLTAEHKKLSQAEGETSAKATEMEKVVKGVSDTLKEQKARLGDNRMEVGNYAIATDGLKDKLGKLSSVNSTLGEATNKMVVGFQFAKDRVGQVKATFGDFTNAMNKHKEATQAAGYAQEQATLLTNAATSANEKATVVGFKFAKGEATFAEVEAVKTEAQIANTVATEAQATAMVAATTATEAGTAAMKIFKFAMASTGIGVLIIAIGSLIAYFKETNEGAKEMKIAMAGVSAVLQNIIKLTTPLGKAIFDAFSGQNQNGIKLATASLNAFLIPLRTIIEVISDLKNGNFKQAFIDIGAGVKDMAVNQVQAYKAGIGFAKDLAINTGKAADEIKRTSTNFKQVAIEGKEVAKQRFDLNKAEREWSTEKIKQQKEVDLLTLKLRQQTLPEKERIALAKTAIKLREKIFDTEIEHAKKNEELINREQGLNSKKDKQAITDAKNRVEQLIANKETEIQGIINRESKLEMKLKNSGESQSAVAAKRHQELMKFIAEEENEMMSSLARQAQTLLDTYGKEISTTEDHYRQLIAKQTAYSIKYPEAKAKTDALIVQLEKEKHAKLLELADRFEKEDTAKLDKISKELGHLAASAVTNVTELQLSQLKLATAEKLELLQKEGKETNELIEKQKAQIILLTKDGKTEEAGILQKSIDRELQILDASGKLREEFLRSQTKKENDIKSGKEFADAKDKLEGDVVTAESKGAEGEPQKIKDQQKLLDLEYSQAVAAAKLKGETTYKIDATYAAKKNELNKSLLSAEKSLLDSKIKTADNALSIVTKNLGKETIAYKAANTARKAIAIRNVIIDSKEAIVKSFKGYAGLPFIGQVLAIAQGAFIASQAVSSIAEINKQKFATGGVYISDGKGGALPGYSKRDNINSQLRSGEGILVSEAMRVPWARNIASAINTAFGGRDFSTPNTGKGFAIGGIYTDGGNSNRYYTQPIQDNQAMANTIAYQLINNFPPIITDVKDVINQAGILTQTQNRVKL